MIQGVAPPPDLVNGNEPTVAPVAKSYIAGTVIKVNGAKVFIIESIVPTTTAGSI